MRLDKVNTQIIAFVDGGMIGSNPGKGGWGAAIDIYLYNGLFTREYYGGTFGDEIVTNNIVEYRAILNTLKVFINHYPDYRRYTIYSDSLFVVKHIMGYINSQKPQFISLKEEVNVCVNKLYSLNVIGKNVASCSLYLEHKPRNFTKEAHNYIAGLLGRKDRIK